MNLLTLNPAQVLEDLMIRYNSLTVSAIKNHLKGANKKQERENYYSAIFAESLNKVSKDEYHIIIPDEDDYRDCELLNLTLYQKNQALSKDHRKADHFLIQNVSIKPKSVEESLKKGERNIYKIFKKHLERTKLSLSAGDYSGCILVFYMGLTIDGKIGIQELRKSIREVKQSKFKQIWTIVPNGNQYQIGELLISNDKFLIAHF